MSSGHHDLTRKSATFWLLGSPVSGLPGWLGSMGSLGKNFPNGQCLVPTLVVAVTSALCQAAFAPQLWTLHLETQERGYVPNGGGQGSGVSQLCQQKGRWENWKRGCWEFVCASVCAGRLFLCVHASVCLCRRMCVNMYVSVCVVCIHVSVCVCVPVCAHVCPSVAVCVCV